MISSLSLASLTGKLLQQPLLSRPSTSEHPARPIAQLLTIHY